MRANKKIHILHVVLTLDIGGLESLVMEMSRRIDKKKFTVSVLCLQYVDSQYKNEMERGGIPVYLIKKKGKLDFSFIAKIRKLLKEQQIDVLHSHSGCFFNAALASFFTGVAGVIYTAHGMPVEYGIKASLENAIAACLTTKLVAVSEEIKIHLESCYPFARRKIELIINGVDTEKFKPVSDEGDAASIRKQHGIPLNALVVGSVGRLEPVKNYQMLVRSFALANHNAQKPLHLVFIGDGGEQNTLVNLSRELGLEGNVSFLGMQYNLHLLVPMLDIFVLSSLSEGTSISLLESQSAGIPAVVTNVGGNNKIIEDGYNGFLCEVNDIDAMASEIELMAKDDMLRHRMGRSSRHVVEEKFSLKHMMGLYEEHYVALHQSH